MGKYEERSFPPGALQEAVKAAKKNFPTFLEPNRSLIKTEFA